MLRTLRHHIHTRFILYIWKMAWDEKNLSGKIYDSYVSVWTVAMMKIISFFIQISNVARHECCQPTDICRSSNFMSYMHTHTFIHACIWITHMSKTCSLFFHLCHAFEKALKGRDWRRETDISLVGKILFFREKCLFTHVCCLYMFEVE